MAYFSNGTEGEVFDEQCSRCKFGQSPCPIAAIQMIFNYDQLSDKTGTAKKIMDELVKDDGTCTVFEMAKSDFDSGLAALDAHKEELYEAINNYKKAKTIGTQLNAWDKVESILNQIDKEK